MVDRRTEDKTRRTPPSRTEGYTPPTGAGETRPGAEAKRETTARETPTGDDRSLGQLIRELGDESSRLLREEVALAKAELREKARVYERNALKMAVGGVLLLGALFVLLVAVNRGLTALLEQWLPLEIAVWLAPLILAVVFALIGWSTFKSGQQAIRSEGITPQRTVETVREEKDWAKQKMGEVRHGNG